MNCEHGEGCQLCAGGGEIDNELNEMAAEELLQAIHSKDKKQVLEAIRAIVLGSKE